MGDALEELRAFEKEQELRLSKAKEEAVKEIEQCRLFNQKRLGLEKKRLADEMEKLILISEADAEKEAERVEKEYKTRLEKLNKNYNKNINKAVKIVFSNIMKENENV